MKATHTTRPRHGAARTAAVVAAAALGTAGTLIAPIPAYAGPVVTVEQNASALDANPKSVTVDCPDGAWVIAVGGWIENNDGRVLLTRLAPDDDMRSATVAARPRSDTAVQFSIVAEAVCATLEVAPTRVTGTSYGTATAQAACKAPEIMMGFGFALDRRVDTWRVDSVVPSDDLMQLTVHAAGSGAGGALTAIGICHTYDPDEPPNNTGRWIMNGAAGAGWPKTATVDSSMLFGWQLGVGGEVVGPDAHLDGFRARPFGTSGVRATRPGSAPGGWVRLPLGRQGGVMQASGDGAGVTGYVAQIGTFH